MKELEMAARKKYEREFNVLATNVKKAEYPASKTITFFLKTNFGLIVITAIGLKDTVDLNIVEYSNKELDVIKSL